MRLFAALLLPTFLALGCASLPKPNESDAQRAQTHFEGVTLQTLELGRHTYVTRCSGCHTLFLPQARAASAWPKLLDEMQTEAKLTPNERKLVEQFLIVMSERSRG